MSCEAIEIEVTAISEESVVKARELLQDGRIDEAARVVRGSLMARPEDSDALYLYAVCQRYQEKFEGALETLARLKALRPAYGRGMQEEGHVHVALEQPGKALRAYRQAVALNESLIASWQAIDKLAENEGDELLSREARDRHRRLAALPPELLSVRNMMQEDRLLDAERLCRLFLQRNPQHVEAMRLLADLGVKAQVLDDAEFILESAVEFEPDNRHARYDYMNVLYRRQKYDESLKQATVLRGYAPGNARYEAAYANQCVAVGRHDEALSIYDSLLRNEGSDPGLHLLRGHALKTIGRFDDAIDAYRNAYRVRADFGDAYWSLANLKTYRFSAAETEAMQAAVEDAATSLTDRIHLSFALGKAREDDEEYEQSFGHYHRGNELRRKELRYDSERMAEQLRLQREQCTPELFSRQRGFGCKAADPIFIVGLPRAGSTLLEQILASHSQVDGTFELPNITALAHRLDGRRRISDAPRYPQRLAELSPADLVKLGEKYIADTRVHRGDAAFFIDKMPNNFRHIGMIQLILPNARIIDARRHPLACCFSGFKQLFAAGQEFTYGLREIGEYYRHYVELMDHWDAVLPGKVLRVQYEDIVENTASQVRRILDYCGLPFEQACVEFHETERSVRTPSSEQVRQPIYRSGMAQWRHFEPWLDPLKEALGPVMARYPLK